MSAQVPSNLIPTRLTQLADDPSPSVTGYLMYVRDGNTYKVQVSSLLAAAPDSVPASRQVIAGTGMSGGGALAANVTLSIAAAGVGPTQLASTGVTPGVYGSASNAPQVTIDAQGRVTSATNVPFVITGYVPDSRQVIAGTGLTGGGTLSADRTFYVDLATAMPLSVNDTGVVGVSSKSARQDHRHPAIELADDTQVNGLLGLDSGGTAKSLVAAAGAPIYSGADGLYVGTAGLVGQVVVSGGAGAPTWDNVALIGAQSANVFYAGPSTGPAAPVSFRTVVAADIPTLNQDSSGSAGSLKSTATTGKLTVTGPGAATTRAMTVPDADFTVATGGGVITGTSSGTNTGDNPGVTSVTGTAPIASSGGNTPAISLNNTAVTPGSYTLASITVDAKGRLTAASSGSDLGGDVVGPASSVGNRVVTFDGVSGKLIKDSGLLLSGSNTGDQTISLTGGVTGSGTGSFAATVLTNANLTGAITSVGNAASLGSFTSAQLATALTDETGTGANVFATSPTLVTPALGTPSALVGTNITGTAAGLSIGGNAATATNTSITASSANAINYITFVSAISGNLSQLVQSGITVNPSTSALTGGIRGGVF